MKFIKIANKEGTMFINLEHVTVITASPGRVHINFTGNKPFVELIDDDADQFMKQCEDIERREIINE